MLLFKPEHIPLILSGRKTQTRRLWPHGPRVKVGDAYQCRTKMLDKSSTFARVKVLRVWQERLNDISGADANAEGYASKHEYIVAFTWINRIDEEANPLLWAVEFKLVTEGVISIDDEILVLESDGVTVRRPTKEATGGTSTEVVARSL